MRQPLTCMSPARARYHDLALGFAGLAFGSASLAFPYGGDQGLYHYIGREWVHGRLPYRDTFDVKTPGIYIVHALCVTLFGERSIWPIRAAELACVLGIGVLVAVLADPERQLRGSRGLGVFTSSVLYYGYFDFWDTGQCEIWCVLFCAAALVAARRQQALLAGLLLGISALFKPPSLIFGPFAAMLLMSSSARSSLVRIALLSIGTVLPLSVLLLYFRAKGAWTELYDVLVVNNRHYVVQGRWVKGAGEFVFALPNRFRLDGILSIVLVNANLVLGWLSWRRGEKASLVKHVAALAAFIAVVVAVGAQLKFCNYHWGLWIGPGAFSAIVSARQLGNYLRTERPALAVATIIACTFVLSGAAPRRWLMEQRAFSAMLSGDRSSNAYHDAFSNIPNLPLFSWRDSVALANVLQQRASADDEVAVRGFEPQVYVLSGLRYSGRFFWTRFLVVPEWSYRMEDWRNEDAATFNAKPPRFVVAIDGRGVDSVDAVETYERLGYRRIDGVPVFQRSTFVLLERR